MMATIYYKKILRLHKSCFHWFYEVKAPKHAALLCLRKAVEDFWGDRPSSTIR